MAGMDVATTEDYYQENSYLDDDIQIDIGEQPELVSEGQPEFYPEAQTAFYSDEQPDLFIDELPEGYSGGFSEGYSEEYSEGYSELADLSDFGMDDGAYGGEPGLSHEGAPEITIGEMSDISATSDISLESLQNEMLRISQELTASVMDGNLVEASLRVNLREGSEVPDGTKLEAIKIPEEAEEYIYYAAKADSVLNNDKADLIFSQEESAWSSCSSRFYDIQNII